MLSFGQNLFKMEYALIQCRSIFEAGVQSSIRETSIFFLQSFSNAEIWYNSSFEHCVAYVYIQCVKSFSLSRKSSKSCI